MKKEEKEEERENSFLGKFEFLFPPPLSLVSFSLLSLCVLPLFSCFSFSFSPPTQKFSFSSPHFSLLCDLPLLFLFLSSTSSCFCFSPPHLCELPLLFLFLFSLSLLSSTSSLFLFLSPSHPCASPLVSVST